MGGFMANYAHALVAAAQSANVTRTRVIVQNVLLNHVQARPGMIGQLAMANKNGICAALTVKFAEAAMLGRLGHFDQNSLAQDLPAALQKQFGSSFFALHSGAQGNFEIGAHHLNPQRFPVNAPDVQTAFMVAMRDAINRAPTSMAQTVAIVMGGDGGHVIGLKIVPGGTSSFFDANAGLYQFPSVDNLRQFWRAAYEAAEYGFTVFSVVTFHKMPPL
jgi:hypothetical protein